MSPSLNVRLTDVLVGCNRQVGALDCGETGNLAYAAHTAVIIVDSQAGRVCCVLQGHSCNVECVRWVPQRVFRAAEGDVLASGGADGGIVWAIPPPSSSSERVTPALLCRLVSPEHAGAGSAAAADAAGVTDIACCSAPGHGGAALVATVGAGGGANIWSLDKGQDGEADGADRGTYVPRLEQHVDMASVVQLCVDVADLPGQPGWLLLASGGVDSKVRLHTRPPDGAFTPASVLTGHDNWVRCIRAAPLPGAMHDGQPDAPGQHLMLATASQDRTVRLWTLGVDQQSDGKGDAPDKFDLKAFAKRDVFCAGGVSYSAAILSILLGHEDWVQSVAWLPGQLQSWQVVTEGVPGGAAAGLQARPRLLSASMDRSMMVWEPEASGSLWMCVQSVGEAGVDALGYLTCVSSPAGGTILANGSTGALHTWTSASAPAAASGPSALLPTASVTGHWNEITDLCWHPRGAFLLTAGKDQTVRAWAQQASDGATGACGRWVEIARPQTHGHDMHALAVLPVRDAWDFRFASASEEKVVRVFKASAVFVRSLGRLLRREEEAEGVLGTAGVVERRGGAVLPALGLSNKEMEAGEAAGGAGGADAVGANQDGGQGGPSSHNIQVPPLEEELRQNTLWPETHKLYGHGNDVFALAASPDGTCLVSSCKAQSAASAELRVWDCGKAELPQVQVLTGHTLTVTQLVFSNDGRLLLSVGRDRSLRLFEALHTAAAGQHSAPAPHFQQRSCIEKAHQRIIWSAAFAPDASVCATASRDKSVKLWRCTRAPGAALEAKPALILKDLPAAATAVAFAPSGGEDAGGGGASAGWLLAVGLEDGRVDMVWVSRRQSNDVDDVGNGAVTLEAVKVWSARPGERHAGAVKRLSFCRVADQSLKLATCGSDHALRIFDVAL